MTSISAHNLKLSTGSKSFYPADTLHAGGSLSGHFTGAFDSLFVDANLNLADVVYDDYSADTLAGNISLSYCKALAGNGQT